METNVEAIVTLNNPYTFVPIIIPVTFSDGVNTSTGNITNSGMNAIGVISLSKPMTAGITYSCTFSFSASTLNNNTPGTVGTVQLIFPNTGTVTPPFNLISDGTTVTGMITVTLNCLHGNSIIVTQNGNKLIKNTVEGDKVLTANGQYATVTCVTSCSIKHPIGLFHNAVIFEPNSLASGIPTERFIIDPGHPIKLNKDDEFKPAGDFITGENIYLRKWNDEIVQGSDPEPSIRWDLVLEPAFDNYIANGVIVKSRKTPGSDAGYYHGYKYWI